MLIRLSQLLVRKVGVIVLAIAALAGVATALAGWGASLDHRADALRHALFRKAPSGETVIVQIDSRSLNEVHSWPIPRGIHGRLVDGLREAGARQIVFDLLFTIPAADAAQDRALRGALERFAGRVWLPALLENVDGEYGERTEMLPARPLRDHARVATIWARLDPDHHARNVPYGATIAGAHRPSLAAALAGRPEPRSGSIAIDWSIDPTLFPTISYTDVIHGRFDADFFRGKNVVVGPTAVGLGDRLTVPTYGHIPAVYAQAVASETLRRHEPVPLGGWPALAAVLVLIGASVLPGRPARRHAALAATAAASLLAPLLLREFTGVIANPGPGMVAALAGLSIALIAAATRAVIERVTLAPISRLPNLAAMSISSPGPASVVAVRLRNHVEAIGLLGPQAQGEMFRKVADRLSLAAGGAPIFQVDDRSFAWRTSQPTPALGDAIEGLHALFASGIAVGNRTVDATITVGICDDLSLDTEAATAAAISAANQAETRGLNWMRYETDDGDDAQWRLSLLNELDRAIDQGDVWLAYQPKYDLKKHRICGAEALVRWTHPLRGEIGPDRFIPLIEDNGRIEKLTLFVLRRAVAEFSTIPGSHSVAVNISARMVGRNRLLDPIREVLEETGFAAERLTLEITESAALAGSAGIDELKKLRTLGVNISIDDYGTGQSTLSYLKTLPATELKIDRSFVETICTSRSDAAVVDSTVKLAHALGLTVVAEGVESKEALTLLEKMNCDAVQGYHIGRPTSFERFLERLRTHRSARAA